MPLSQGKGSPTDIAREWRNLGTEGSCVAALKDGRLIVHVDCSGRMVKMNLNKALYLEELQKKNLQIKEIRFKVGPLTA